MRKFTFRFERSITYLPEIPYQIDDVWALSDRKLMTSINEFNLYVITS